MLTITKSVKFDAAHVLTNHNGLCKNLHGHTYRVDVSVRQAENDSSDMVMDFKDVKNICEETVLSKFDHAFIYDETSAGESEIAAVVVEGEATLKRLYYYPAEEKLVLAAENPDYPPLVFIGSELESIHILGRAVAFQSKLL